MAEESADDQVLGEDEVSGSSSSLVWRPVWC
jgi:hypothetical protein